MLPLSLKQKEKLTTNTLEKECVWFYLMTNQTWAESNTLLHQYRKETEMSTWNPPLFIYKTIHKNTHENK